jgi:hypothetical protein
MQFASCSSSLTVSNWSSNTRLKSPATAKWCFSPICWSRSPNAGIDNAEENGSCWKPPGISRQQICGCLRIADWCIGKEVDNRHAGCLEMQHGFHLTRIRTLQPEISEQHNHCSSPHAIFDGSEAHPAPIAKGGTTGGELAERRLSFLRRIHTRRDRAPPLWRSRLDSLEVFYDVVSMHRSGGHQPRIALLEKKCLSLKLQLGAPRDHIADRFVVAAG